MGYRKGFMATPLRRSSDLAGAEPGAGAMEAPGDWMCGDAVCGNVNFARRSACNRCGRRRAPPAAGTEIGKCAADKSRGLFAADDWQCAKCANVNWARRLTCNVCNAPKFGEVEARTGYGGGYNERGIVEYRPRRDSDDDEYDEFGRVKKRKAKEATGNLSKVCGNRRRLGSLSDSSETSAPHAPRFPLHPAESTRRDSTELHGQSATKRDMSPKKIKRSTTRSSDRIGDDPETPVDRKSHTKNGTDKAYFSNKPPFVTRDISLEKHKSLNRDYPESFNYQNLPRDCIMENRVTSTDQVKYRFKGKTVDENFEVTYTLQERIKVAAWAIVYQNCRVSAEKFQSNYDKPAPDFKTIFSWRQRLLNTGCLVDSHLMTETSGREASDSCSRKRKKRRYFKQIPHSIIESSDNDSSNGKIANISQARERIVSLSNSDDNREPFSRKTCDEKSDNDTNSENKQSMNDNNGSICRSSTSGAKQSVHDGGKQSECFMTDNARSLTPEITAARVELAQLKSPVRVISPETQFQGDIYFETDLEKSQRLNAVPAFLIPEIPKQTVCIPITKQKQGIFTKGMLEDIVSESERYSSDGGDFDPIVTHNSKSSINSDYQKSLKPTVLQSAKEILIEDDSYRSKSTQNVSKKIDVIDLPLPRFGQHKTKDPSIVTFQTKSIELEQGSGKVFGPAMRRVIESMSIQSEDNNSSNIEYVPTKIDPEMAKRNLELFEKDLMSDDKIHEIWPDSSDGPINDTEKSVEDLQIPTESANTTANKVSEEEELYGVDPVEPILDNMSDLPPKAPNIGSICGKNIFEDLTKNKDINNDKMLLNFNFSEFNPDVLVKALTSIQEMERTALNKNMKNDQTESHNPLKSTVNIPFINDMFYPGTPVNDVKQTETIVEDGKQTENVDLVLDDTIEYAQNKRNNNASIIGGFKSFAIPKPIMLNMLMKNINQKQTNNQDGGVAKTKSGKRTKKGKAKKRASDDNNHNNDTSKKLYDDDDEESGDDGDLSKYELWESEDEGKNVKNISEKETTSSPPIEKEAITKTDSNQRREPSKSPLINESKRRYSERSLSGSSRRSTSSSSSSGSSSGKPPRNKYDDFILNSEHSRAGSRDGSSSARSRSPIYDRSRDRDKRRSRSRDKLKDRSRDIKNRDKERIPKRDLNKSRDKGRDRNRERQRHHYRGAHSNHGGYVRGRAR